MTITSNFKPNVNNLKHLWFKFKFQGDFDRLERLTWIIQIIIIREGRYINMYNDKWLLMQKHVFVTSQECVEFSSRLYSEEPKIIMPLKKVIWRPPTEQNKRLYNENCSFINNKLYNLTHTCSRCSELLLNISAEK